jgi:hypothetical protein
MYTAAELIAELQKVPPETPAVVLYLSGRGPADPNDGTYLETLSTCDLGPDFDGDEDDGEDDDDALNGSR